MPELITLFLTGLIVSFLGSVPPGTINVTAMQLALAGDKRSAYSFSIAASIVEFFYAIIAVNFQLLLTKNTVINSKFQIITAFALVIIGLYNFFQKASNSSTKKLVQGGFGKGILLGIANPLCIPFWLGITAYLQSNDLITIVGWNYMSYALGISLGTLFLLIFVIRLTRLFEKYRNNTLIVYKIPGVIFTIMGIYTFYNWAAQ